MKRFLLFSLLVAVTGVLHAQLEENFSTDPSAKGWILAQGAQWKSAESIIITPGAGSNDPSMIGTPAVNKTSNTVKVCVDIKAQDANGTPIVFPCSPTYMDVLFVNSSVTTTKESVVTANTLASVTDYVLSNTGTQCVTFTFPANVVVSDFKVFLSFHAPCGTGGFKYVIDNVSISGVDEVCGSGGNCAPTALDDLFNRGNKNELSFDAVVYGSNLLYPAPGTGVAVDAGGTDNDQNDNYSHLQWSVLTQPVNGSVTINANGTATITRLSSDVMTLVFTYRLTDDGADNNFATTGDNLYDDATVTVNWPANASLPVSMVNYNVSRSGSYVTLQWTTTAESNNTGFIVQRSTANGVYENVGFVNTKAPDGYSQTELQYTFKELNTFTGTSWYRLVQKDKDGTLKVYGSKGIRGTEESAKIVVYPNPGTSGNMNVLFSSTASREITIADLSGKVVKHYNDFHDDNLTISGLNPGMYMLLVINKVTNDKQAHKIVVIK